MRETFALDDLFNSVISLEQRGNSFYSALSSKTNEDDIKKIFTILAKAEERHEVLYKQLKDEYTDSEPVVDKDYKEYLNHLIQSSFSLNEEELKEYSDLKKAFNFALNLEKDTIIFLNELKELLSEKGKKAILSVIKEERSHIVSINKLSEKYLE